MYFIDDILDILLINEIWDEKKEERLNGLQKDIDEIKLKLFQYKFSDKDNQIVRLQLSKAKVEVEQLEGIRHSLDHLTVEGVAGLAKQRFLIGSCINPNWDEINFWESNDNLIDKVMESYVDSRIIETEFREIARTDPWIRTWSACKNPRDIFGVHTIDLNDEQRNLVAWSILYDNVLDHPERPSEDVIEDDDRLDGWILHQRRKREIDQFKQKIAEKTQNSKIANAGEIYITPESDKEISLIEELNDPVAKMMKTKRLALLKKKGEVHELDMPDTKQRLMNAIREKFKGATS